MRKYLISFLVVGLLLAGCTCRDLPPPIGPKPYVVNNVYAPVMIPNSMQRVAVLPIYFAEDLPLQQLKNFDEIFVGELLKKKRFEVVSLDRDEMNKQFSLSQFNSTGAFPHNFLSVIKNSTQADGLIFVEITHYQPYKPIAMGIRCKLLSFSNEKFIWAVDELFNVGNPAVYKAFKNYQNQQGVTNFSLTYDDTLFCTPSTFARYTAYEIFSQIPPHTN